MEKSKNNTSIGLPRMVRQVNLQTVTRQMRRMELFSKIDLARQLGISTTTMTKLFAQLQGEDLIQPSPELDTSFGRPKILYQLSSALQVAAIVIDVETTTICFSGLQGDISSSRQTSFPTNDDPKKLFSQIATEFSKLRKHLNAPCHLIGVCIPGLIEAQTGQSMLNPNLHWLEGLFPAEIIAKKTKLKTFIMHEEKALSRAQLRATDDSEHYIAMDFSSGVGMSVVTNGNHLSGTSGYAGEIGHIITEPGGKLCGCGNRGCLETIASDRAFQSAMKMPMDDALKKLRQGLKRPSEFARQVVLAQATGIAAAINIFNPEKIFVHSRLSDSFPNYVNTLRDEVEKRSINLSFSGCAIETTHDGKTKGALLQTIDHLIEQATSGGNR